MGRQSCPLSRSDVHRTWEGADSLPPCRACRTRNASFTAANGTLRSRRHRHNYPAMDREHAEMGTVCFNKRIAAPATLLLLSLSLGGCATSSTGSSLMGAHAEVPASSGAYLPVEDLPASRDKPAMSTEERAKLRKELIAARDRQTSRVKAREGEPRKP
jgi:hypothetical protein